MTLQEMIEEDNQHLFDADSSREAMRGIIINPDYVARGVWKIGDLDVISTNRL